MPNFPDDVAREAYSHEVTSVGSGPAAATRRRRSSTRTAYPTPDGFSEATVAPEAAFWLAELGEFSLPYEAVAASDDPDGDLLAVRVDPCGAADLAGWDRDDFECEVPHGPDWWHNRPH